MKKDVRRLFRQFQPEHYNLTVRPDRGQMTFTGIVTIRGKKIGRPTQRLTFHQNGLKITEASVTKHDKKGDLAMAVDRINLHAKYDEVRLHTPHLLYPGQYTVRLRFSGKITRPMNGIYPCFFKHDGQDKQLIATQFESHHAREAFPCIDEPEAKATFDLTITSPANEVVLANTPVKRETVKGKLKDTTFETTPRMSTYLLAFVMGEMHSEERKTKDGTLVRSWSTVAQPKSHLAYSVDQAVKLLEFFTDYFGVPYPLAKCDHVALPDFDAGAMENWGIITYREIALLADPKNRSISGEQYVSLVIAHELSHQWFGNLVTMQWWDDLWLNESFASLMEHLALDAVYPDWQQWETYAASDVLGTTSRDIYSDIQPVSVKVSDPAIIHTLFDPGIVYAKGARLLKMLREYIGDKAFANGLQRYFKKHAYGNATRQDLWEALEKASGRKLSSLMNPWLVHPGMPLVRVTQHGRDVELSQQRFTLDAIKDSYTWPVPLLADNPLTPQMLTKKHGQATTAHDGYTLLNQYASGHYVTYYTEPDHRAHIARNLQTQAMTTEARINVLNDMYLLARHGDAPLTDALDVVVGCDHEPRENVWTVMARILNTAHQLTEGDEASDLLFKNLKVKLARYWHDKLGWNDGLHDDPNTKHMRQLAISFMIGGEEPSAIQHALGLYAKHDDLHDIPAELRTTVLIAAIRHTDSSKVAERLLKAYPTASPEVQLDITSALSANRDPALAGHILNAALGKDGLVRAQDALRWIALFLRNHYVRETAWDIMLQQWSWLEESLQSSKAFDYLPIYCSGIVTTPEWQQKFHKLFDPLKDNKTLARNIAVGTADIVARIAWRKRDEQKIAAWLQNHAS